jgi:hypothetical protein
MDVKSSFAQFLPERENFAIVQPTSRFDFAPHNGKQPLPRPPAVDRDVGKSVDLQVLIPFLM